MADRYQEGNRILSSCPLCGVGVCKLDKHLNELCLARPLPGQIIEKGVCPHCLTDVGVDGLNTHLMSVCQTLTVQCPFCNERHRQIQQHLNRHHKNERNNPGFTSVRKVPNPYKVLNGNLQDIAVDSIPVSETKIKITSPVKQIFPETNKESVKDEERSSDTDTLTRPPHESTLDTDMPDCSYDFGDEKTKMIDQPENFQVPKNNSRNLIRCQLCGNRVLLTKFNHHANNKCLARPLPGQSLEPGYCPHCVKRIRVDEMSGHLMYECAKLTVRCPFCYLRFRQIRQHLNAKHKNKCHLPEFLNITKIPNPFKLLRGDCLNVPEPSHPLPEVGKQVFYEDSSDSGTELDYESFLIRPPKT